jgi:type II secretory pathway pseudopilin PulG
MPATNAVSRRERGFTYIALLLAVAFMGVALAAVGTVWATAARRDREQQLLFAGGAYREAIRSYVRVGQRYPGELQDLIEDGRTGDVRRHLRRLYADPMTGQVDWDLIRNPDGGITGVVSTAIGIPLKQANFPPEDAAFLDSKCYCDWRFQYLGPQRSRRATPPAGEPLASP